MNFIWFMVFGTLETSAIYYMMFRMFKFDIYISSIIFASSIVTFFSYTLREVYGFDTLDVVLQNILMIVFVWQLFRVQVLYAILMTSISFILYVLMQVLLFMLINALGLISDVPNPTSFDTYILQILSSLITYLIGFILYKKNKGFTFVPHSSKRFTFSRLERRNLFVMLGCSTVLVPAALSLIFVLLHSNHLFFFFPVLLCLILCGLLYWAFKKEQTYD